MTKMIDMETVRQAEEIDLRQVLESVLRTRKPLLLALLAVSLAFWGLMAFKGLAKPAVHSYTSTIQLVFPELNKGEYPNGSPFRIEDVVAPSVLNGVYESDGLGDYFQSPDEFARALSVKPYAPDRELILERYRAVIDPKKMTPAELQLAQDSLRQELQRASTGVLAVTLTLSDRQVLPATLIEKILQDVPQEWARQVIERRGVIKLDVPLYSQALVDESLVASMEYLILFDYVNDKVAMVRANVEQLRGLPNADTVRDPQSGLGLADLERALGDLERYHIATLMVPLRRLQIANSPSAVKFYFENKLAELQREKNELQQRARDAREAYGIYVANERAPRAGSGEPGLAAGGSTLMPQLGDNFLDRLLQLANKDRDIDYRQQLTTEIMRLNQQATATDTRISRVREIIEAFEQPLDPESLALREHYLGQVEQGLPVILDRLRGFLATTANLYAELSRENIGYTGKLFKHSGVGVVHDTQGTVLNAGTLRWYAVLLFLTALVVVPVVMLRNALRGPRRLVAAAERPSDPRAAES